MTVLFSDLYESTTIAERLDPEYHGLSSNTSSSRSARSYRREGIVNPKPPATGIMALFGAPVAHGDAPARSDGTRRAQALTRLNSGSAPSAASAPRAHRRTPVRWSSARSATTSNGLTAIGDTTNLAARLSRSPDLAPSSSARRPPDSCAAYFRLSRRSAHRARQARSGERPSYRPADGHADGDRGRARATAFVDREEGWPAARRLPAARAGGPGRRDRQRGRLRQIAAAVSSVVESGRQDHRAQARCSSLSQAVPFPFVSMFRQYVFPSLPAPVGGPIVDADGKRRTAPALSVLTSCSRCRSTSSASCRPTS